MKVLIPMEGLFPGKHGGIENFIYSLVRGFNQACPDIDLFLQITPGTSAAFKQVLPGARVTYLEDERFSKIESWFNKTRALQFVWRIVVATRIGSWLKGNRTCKWREYCQTLVDVVLYPTWRLPIMHTSKPVVMIVHDFRWFERPETGPELRALLRQAPIAAMITAWPNPFAILCRLFPELKDSSFMVPFIMDSPPSVNFADNEISGCTLVYTSSNGKEKNHEVLIRALGILKRRGAMPVRVFCTGPIIPDRSEVLNSLIREEDVGDRIFFLGWVPREFVHWLYRNVSGVITTTTYEAMSGTVIEGWQHGKPVACSDIPSIRAITDLLGVEVRFFNPMDSQDISCAIEELHETPERYTRGSELARSFLANITPEVTALQYRDILAWVCGKAEKPSWHPFRAWWDQ